MTVSKMSESQYRIALDLGKHASERTKQILIDTTGLCTHPGQHSMIGLMVAAGAIGHVSAGIMLMNPNMSRVDVMAQTFVLLEEVLSGGKPLSSVQTKGEMP